MKLKRLIEYYNSFNKYDNLKERIKKEEYKSIKNFVNKLKKEFTNEVKTKKDIKHLPERYISKLEDYIGNVDKVNVNDVYFRKYIRNIIEDFRKFVYNYKYSSAKLKENLETQSSVFKKLKQKVEKFSSFKNSQNRLNDFKNFLQDLKENFKKNFEKGYDKNILYDYYMGIVNKYIFEILSFEERINPEVNKLTEDFKTFILNHFK